jgi:hypothetical protein
MPKAFDTWNVLPHRPIEKLTENLWSVEGDLPQGGGTRRMTVARLRDGRLVIHNAIALEEPLMKEIEAFGTPAAIVVPNGFHRLDAKVFKGRYPDAKVFCPAGTRKKVSDVVDVSGSYDEAPSDETVRLFHIEGCREGEGVLEVKSLDGVTLTFNDAICNLPKVGGFIGFFLAPTGKASVPRFTRWMIVKDKTRFRGHLEKLGETENLRRLLVSHGPPLAASPNEGRTTLGDVLRAVAKDLS